MSFISNEAYERVLEEQQEEEKEDSNEALADEDFDPQPGDFLLFPNFQDVPYHLIRVKTRPFKDHITFNYYGVKKTNKQRLKGWQLVWTHPSLVSGQTILQTDRALCAIRCTRLEGHPESGYRFLLLLVII